MTAGADSVAEDVHAEHVDLSAWLTEEGADAPYDLGVGALANGT
jgi:hypothetical protein